MNTFDRAPHRIILVAVANAYGVELEKPSSGDVAEVRRVAFHKMQVQETWDGIFPEPLFDHRVSKGS